MPKDEKELNKVQIIFNSGSFNYEQEKSELHDFKKYTTTVKKMNELAEKLDRFDDFADLSLKPSDYKKNNESDTFGIPKKDFHFGDDRLLDNQVTAVQRFLRDLRGFGLLADVVGTGKTYEALAALSELSAKGKVSSDLFIVPSQVYAKWVHVAEEEFGLGSGIMNQVSKFDIKDYERTKENFYVAKRPMIVSSEDFVTWLESDLKDVLFDVVIVDEAHNLCSEEGENARALKLLAILMETKKRANKSYCILLSATPHAGNLEQMFRLWYFIRCRGGNPDDFDVKTDDQRTLYYRNEKEFYKTRICRNATTVMEFIINVKKSTVEQEYKSEFEKYLLKNKIKYESYEKLLDSEKKKLINEFLDDYDNQQISNEVSHKVAEAYHSGVLRSIMIRQPNKARQKAKYIDNILFFPTTIKDRKVMIKDYNDQDIIVNVDDLNGDTAINYKGNDFSIKSYFAKYPGNYANLSHAASEIYGNLFNAYGLTDDRFSQQGSVGFYLSEIRDSQLENIGRKIQFIPTTKSIVDAKYDKLVDILRKHNNERILIFFDYDIEEEKIVDGIVTDRLKNDPDFSKRIIEGSSSDKQSINEEFNKKKDAILIVRTVAFTEGTDFQKGSIVVNFQVTPDPLAMEQRVGRIFRLGQENDITIYSLADMTDLEGYVLMYFTVIGLMNSNSGDAAIIAGSNNDNMVTIRCESCGKVKLMSKDDYLEYDKNDNKEIYCVNTASCRNASSMGRKMVEINCHELKCDTCGILLKRQRAKGGKNDGGSYLCLKKNGVDRGILCNEGKQNDRQIYCKKICSIMHCNKFINGDLKGKCEVYIAYKEDPTLQPAELLEICNECSYIDICGDCRMGTGIDAIKPCTTCRESHACIPRPHIIKFELDKWEAECPVCKEEGRKGKRGKLKPVQAKTFDVFIKSLFTYHQTNDDSFCKILSKETSKVAQIQDILKQDAEEDR